MRFSVVAVSQFRLRDPLRRSFVRQEKQDGALINDLEKVTLPLDPR